MDHAASTDEAFADYVEDVGVNVSDSEGGEEVQISLLSYCLPSWCHQYAVISKVALKAV